MKPIDVLVQAIRYRGGDICMPHAIDVLVDDGVDAWGGPYSPELPSFPNIMIGCLGLSEAGMDAASAIHAATRGDNPVLDVTPCALLVYMVDGAPIWDMPIAKQARAYKKPRWLPMLVKLGPGA